MLLLLTLLLLLLPFLGVQLTCPVARRLVPPEFYKIKQGHVKKMNGWVLWSLENAFQDADSLAGSI